MPVQNLQLSKPVLMVKFYLLNLPNTLSFEARPLLEHLPYEEGIKTLIVVAIGEGLLVGVPTL